MPLFRNQNDGTNEGICHKQAPFFSVQFHPEAAPGPQDTAFLFDDFVKLMQARFEKMSHALNNINPAQYPIQLKPSLKSIKKVILLGSGALKIGEAGRSLITQARKP